MTQTIYKEQLLKTVEQSGIVVVREMLRFFNLNEDFVFPHVILTLILSGSARAKYDMRVITPQERPDHHPPRSYHASCGLY